MFHHLTVEDGLLEARNDFIYKDSYGFVWISSLNGLIRFDGQKIKPYQQDFDDPNSLFGQNIQSPFFETRDKDIVFTTYEGINIYNRKKDNFDHYLTGDSLNWYYAFHIDPDNKLWFINQARHLYTFDLINKTFHKKYTFPSQVLRVTPRLNKEGYIDECWGFSYQLPGLVILKKEGESFFIDEKEKKKPALNYDFNEILFDGYNKCWLATHQGLLLYEIDKNKIADFTPKGIATKEINAISFFDKGKMMVAAENEGIFIFERTKKEYRAQIKADSNNPYSMSSDNVNKIYVDPDNGVWLSTIGIGIDFYHPEKTKFAYFKLINDSGDHGLGFHPNPVGIVELVGEKKQIWCATKKEGIFVLDENRKVVDHIYIKNGKGAINSDEINFIFRDKENNVWVNSWGGVVVFMPDGSRQNISTDSLDFLYTYQLHDGRILTSCFYGGIYEIKKNELGQIDFISVNKKLHSTTFTTLWENSDGLLFACRDVSAISILDPQKGFEIIDEIPLSGESNSFFENAADGSIWIANNSGLVRAKKTGGKWEIRFFTEKDGLPDRTVYGTLPDDNNYLWVSTNRGLASFHLENHAVQRFSLADGLPTLASSSWSCLKLSSGELLFGTPLGITNFFPQNIKPLGIKAQPVITDILVDDVKNPDLVRGQDNVTNVNILQELVIPFERNTLSFNFAALEYSDPANVNFKYKMEGLDDDWVDNGSQNFARYPNIPHGNYQFKLMAANSDGIWSDPVSLKIEITPPFTRTPLFYFLMGILAVGSVFLVFYVRQKRREERRRLEEEKRKALELERQRIARDVHDDLGSGLSALSLQTAMAQYKSSPEDLKSELDKINAAARDLSGKIREVIWTVSSKNDTLANLISYLNQYALDLLENSTIDISVSLPEHIPDSSVTGEYRRTTFLAFKEALNNIVKHAQASQVDIQFKATASSFKIEVMDNGVGFDPQLLESSTGNGLINMRTRMREIGGDCQFFTNGTGTRVVFTLLLENV